MDDIAIGIVGTGYIARIHAQAVLATPGIRLAAVAGRSDEPRQVFARDLGIPAQFENAEELIAFPDVDAVILATPNAIHARHAVAAFEAGKHVLVEKPMACSSNEAHQMIQAAERASRTLMVGHMWRFDPEVLRLRDRLRTGAIGTIYRTHGFGTHVNWGPTGWFVDPSLAWGGALADMGIHAIDTARFLLGDPLPVRVHGITGSWTGAVEQLEDTALVTVEWENGVVSTIESGWWQPHVDGPEAGTRLYGTRGYASLFPTLIRTRATNLTPPGEDDIGYDLEADALQETSLETAHRAEHCDPRAYAGQIAEFAGAIREGVQPVPGGYEGAVNVAIVEAAYRSSRTRQVVSVTGSRLSGRG
jgi:predicted dehydrogenase